MGRVYKKDALGKNEVSVSVLGMVGEVGIGDW